MYEKIKRIAIDAMGEAFGLELTQGTLLSLNPVKIQINQQMVLPKEYFIFPEHLEEHVLVTKDWKTTASSGGDVCSGSSISEITRTYILQPKLKAGDKLILIKIGSNFLVFDRVGDPNGTITITE